MHARYLLPALAAALGVGLWVAADRTPPAPSRPPDEYRVSGPFTHANLSVFLLHAPDALPERPVLGLDEALAGGQAIMHETGTVGELAVENLSADADLLLLSGDIVKGGKQDRAIFETQLVPPKSGRVPVRSICVEQGRWAGRKADDAGRFATNPGVVAGKVKQAVQLAGNQGEVWQTVAGQQGLLGRYVGASVQNAESPTSLQLALENGRVEDEVRKYRDALRRRVKDLPDVVGFVTVVNGRVTGAEAFGSHTLFRKAWAKALDAAAVEAVSEKTDTPFAAVSADEVRAFLTSAGDRRSRADALRENLGSASFAVADVEPGTVTVETRIDSLAVAGARHDTTPEAAGGLTGRAEGNPFNPGGRNRGGQWSGGAWVDGRGGTADVITEVNNLIEPMGTPSGVVGQDGESTPSADASFNRLVRSYGGEGDTLDYSRIPNDVRARYDTFARWTNNPVMPTSGNISRDDYGEEFARRLANSRRPSPQHVNETVRAAVVEYRDGRANGAVIHRSFLAK